ncbi:NTP transferase domain-containing protein [Halarchaeum sp. CBA1220]|uniref:sugar nucleotidyltransferase n=1 Tax=Halarchaeum sp. CBA1220 TaxID=1853682 RepID=UPI0015A3AD44|nr:sugar phosphate nucleotidyltransferase [Halarchaeum sp. CBA1220]QLC34405.1 NTP transferase domain-containing protein [Halarchaeum sp. CBA1220]
MKAVVPAAGQGTRLYPQTHTKPKPMVRLAGKPILGHILEGFVGTDVEDVVVVVGVMKEKVIEYAESAYGDDLTLEFVEQAETKGLGHSIYQAREAVGDEPMCITLGDMLFEQGYERFLEAYDALDDVDGALGVKEVADPSNYGVVTTAADGTISKLEEKPDDPDSNLAISGLYFVDASDALFDAIGELVENDVRGAGDEYQLTDALQKLLERGLTLGTFPVEEWYDCGRPETLLEANRALLGSDEEGRVEHDGTSVVLPPADVGDDVTIENSVIGPYVSVDDGAEIVDSRVSDAILGRDATLRTVNLESSILGDGSSVEGTQHRLNVGDFSEVNL